MTDKRFEELLATFGGVQPLNEDGIRLVHPSNTCSQRMRVSKWKRYELYGVHGTTSTPIAKDLDTAKIFVASNGMRVRLHRSPTS